LVYLLFGPLVYLVRPLVYLLLDLWFTFC
jgi:hypothetical protein